MARKAFLLRVDPGVLAAVQKWADDDLRSLNAQIEFILRQALTRRGTKLPARDPGDEIAVDETGNDGRPAAG
jgi:hypothetical protein